MTCSLRVSTTRPSATMFNYGSGRPAFGEPATVTGTDGDVIQDARVHRHRRELEACFIIRDHNGQQLAYVYFEKEPRLRSAAKLLTRDEARRIAANVAKLPQLLRGASALTYEA